MASSSGEEDEPGDERPWEYDPARDPLRPPPCPPPQPASDLLMPLLILGIVAFFFLLGLTVLALSLYLG